MTENTKYVDHLDEDERVLFPHAKEKKNPTTEDYQNWVCVSFLSPEGIQNCSLRGLKIRGVFATYEEATARATELQASDQNFHVFVGEVGKWLPWDPDPNSVKDQEYQNKELNDLMKGYKDNLEKSKKVQQERKQDMIKQAAAEEQGGGTAKSSKTKAKLQQKLAARKLAQQAGTSTNTNTNTNTNTEKTLTEKEKELQEFGDELKNEESLAKTERQRLDTINKTINDKKQNIESIDSKLEKIKELYEKLNSKK